MPTLTPKQKVLQLLQKRGARYKFKELCTLAKLTPKRVEQAIAEIRQEKPNLNFAKFDKTYYLADTPTWYTQQTDLSHVLPVEGSIGLVSDTHLGSVAERLDLVNQAYDKFAQHGVQHVFHTGDLTDGWQEYRGHINYVKVFGDAPQAARVIKSYPKRDGITTYVIAGNHDMCNYGKGKVDRLSLVAHGFTHEGRVYEPRKDIVYLGQYSHYVLFPQEVRMHMLHPRGKQAYALSYKQQKRHESMGRNDMPDIQISGHFHTFTHIWLDGCHMLALPGMQDATEYFVRLGLPRSIGFVMARYKIEKGALSYFAPEVYML